LELKNGIWHGRVVGMADQPEIVAVHNGDEVPGLEVQTTKKGIWTLRVPAPLAIFSDGVHSCVVSLANGDLLGKFTVISGEPLAHELQA
jgi:hypothetical protein